MPRGKSSTRRQGPRPRYLWVTDALDPLTVAQNAQGVSELLTNVDTAVQAGATVMRIIGTWGARANSSDSVGAMKIGILVMSEDALLASALPEMDLDHPRWLFLDERFIYDGFITETGNQWNQRDFDVSSRRRLDHESKLAVIVENVSSIAYTLQVIWSLRTLLRLS